MITNKLATREHLKSDIELVKHFTTEELLDIIESSAQEKYCPHVKGNCKGHNCAMFVIDRPYADPRYIESRCTFAGTRALGWTYGEPKDFELEVTE